jgi:GTP-binding protein
MVPAKQIKIAEYPFTTLKPQVLDVKFDKDEYDQLLGPGENFSLNVADLPGIIEGASRNRGRGYEFLKHLEYSEIVIMVIDVHGFRLSEDNFEEPFR